MGKHKRNKWVDNPNQKNKWVKKHLLRTTNICGLCKEVIHNMKEVSIDHIVPLSKGGRDAPDNMQIAHIECNLKKGNQL